MDDKRVDSEKIVWALIKTFINLIHYITIGSDPDSPINQKFGKLIRLILFGTILGGEVGYFFLVCRLVLVLG